MIITGIDNINIQVRMSHADAALIAELLRRCTNNQYVKASDATKPYHTQTLLADDAISAALSFERTVGREIKLTMAYLKQIMSQSVTPAAQPAEHDEGLETIKARVN